ncbi:hypothetical protein X769_23175 [Mesorhizobium sp. LSJC268A00]|nr:hypothetical protein X769_23175 [Mesorhizobium sp. LSJC268A00]ESX60513.1 hypothetical protein X760_14985 [Mesorhizobium sp. LSHC422A00]ESX84702.1 hypothetical protein X756_25270 [Mesorhizobium sp. LSHC412B00]ESY16959.1 hypothetical protein X750_25025 [Mesorhizobium sp. LNJC394B00]ESZ11752.1 hypothetical protein X735_24495 [Mesorhizobium sp. L2C085B000]ESZ41022.1 hypothetical protein X731_24870 [Mesorhizobium sp. L2C054A000]ESZ44177.1 hypothetical protein X730_26995 [Mesorhizobium sp. L103C
MPKEPAIGRFFLRLVRRAANYAKDRASVAIQAAAAVLY